MLGLLHPTRASRDVRTDTVSQSRTVNESILSILILVFVYSNIIFIFIDIYTGASLILILILLYVHGLPLLWAQEKQGRACYGTRFHLPPTHYYYTRALTVHVWIPFPPPIRTVGICRMLESAQVRGHRLKYLGM